MLLLCSACTSRLVLGVVDYHLPVAEFIFSFRAQWIENDKDCFVVEVEWNSNVNISFHVDGDWIELFENIKKIIKACKGDMFNTKVVDYEGELDSIGLMSLHYRWKCCWIMSMICEVFN